MTSEEIRVLAVDAIQEPSELKVGAYVPKLRENIESSVRKAAAQAYGNAAQAICFFCRNEGAPHLEGDNWLHGENNRCHAHDIHTLKGLLEPPVAA